MAEVLGTVASVIAVVQISSQAGSTVVKLRSLWSQVRNVPETIRDLMKEIEILDPIVSEMETEFGDGVARLSPLLFDDTAARLSAGYCREALEGLQELVRELVDQIESSQRSKRGVAKLKVVLKKVAVVRLEKRLHRAVRLLNSAQLSYLMWAYLCG
jgi:hypothetical protein